MSRIERQIKKAGGNVCFITKKSDKNSISSSWESSNMGKIFVFCINFKDEDYMLVKSVFFVNNGITEAL